MIIEEPKTIILEEIKKAVNENKVTRFLTRAERRFMSTAPEQRIINKLHCLRCKGKPWWPRKDKPSFRCPHCHSKLWNVPPRPGKLRRGFMEQGVIA